MSKQGTPVLIVFKKTAPLLGVLFFCGVLNISEVRCMHHGEE